MASLQIDENRAVGGPTTQRPIIHAQDLRSLACRQRCPPNEPKETVGAHRHRELHGETRPGLCPDYDGDGALGRRESAGATRPHVEQAGEPLGKGAPCTGGLSAVEAPYDDLQANATPERWEVRRTTEIRAVWGAADGVAARARCPIAGDTDAKDSAAFRLSTHTINHAAGYGIQLLHPESYPCRALRVTPPYPRKVRESRFSEGLRTISPERPLAQEWLRGADLDCQIGTPTGKTRVARRCPFGGAALPHGCQIPESGTPTSRRPGANVSWEVAKTSSN
jgi:hypothetical protein